MDKNYGKALSIVEDALNKINSIYDNAKIETFEDIKGCKAMEKVIGDLEGFTSDIRHYSKKTEEGYLKLNSNGRYELNNEELSCGYPIEVYNDKSHEWNDGRVEYTDKYAGYYFYNYDEEHFSLTDGMKARIRI